MSCCQMYECSKSFVSSIYLCGHQDGAVMLIGGSFSKHFSLLGDFCEGSLSSGLVSFVTLLCKLGRVICSLSGLGERLAIGGRGRGEFGRI